MRICRFLILLIIVLVACINNGGKISKQSPDTSPYVLLVSFDGFRYDYVSKYHTPNFDLFIESGAAAGKMLPSFPSKTFPNHYTVVTGLYPGHHGLVDNTFYDSQREQIYNVSNRKLVEDEYYYGGMPLWQLAQSQGLKSASFFWVGSEAPVTGNFPDYYKLYDGSVVNQDRIKQVISWLELPDGDRPHFISLYFSFLDDVGHTYGPDSNEIMESVKRADDLLGLIRSEVEKLPFGVNIILVSDHGMYPMTNDPETFIYLDEQVNLSDTSLLTINNGTHVHIYSLNGDQVKIDSIYHELQQNDGSYSVYLKEDFKEEWHYKNNRSGDLLLLAKPGKYVVRTRTAPSDEKSNWGTHGYDPYDNDEMAAIFYANGPNIARGVTVDPFENVHVYPLIAKILGLNIPEIDGTLEVLEPIYVDTSTFTE